MGARTKFAIVFVPLLIGAVIALSLAELDRSAKQMTDNLHEFGSILIKETLEQIQVSLTGATEDPIQVLSHDRALSALLASGRAFSEGVVYARVETLDGRFLAGVPNNGEDISQLHPQPFSALLEKEDLQWRPLARIAPLWRDHIYEMRRQIELNGRPFAVIRVGLSTALVWGELARTMVNVSLAGVVVILTGLLVGLAAGAVFFRSNPVNTTEATSNPFTEENVSDLRKHTGDGVVIRRDKLKALVDELRTDDSGCNFDRFITGLRSISDALILLDAEGKIRFANDEACGRLGLPAGGIEYGKPLSSFVGTDHPLVRLLRSVLVSGVDLRDVTLETDGREDSVDRIASAFSLGRRKGSPTLAIVRDLTQAPTLENISSTSKRLDRIEQMVSDIASEIRILLRAMTAEFDLVAKDVRKSRLNDGRIQVIRDQIRAMDSSIDALSSALRPDRRGPHNNGLEHRTGPSQQKS